MILRFIHKSKLERLYMRVYKEKRFIYVLSILMWSKKCGERLNPRILLIGKVLVLDYRSISVISIYFLGGALERDALEGYQFGCREFV